MADITFLFFVIFGMLIESMFNYSFYEIIIIAFFSFSFMIIIRFIFDWIAKKYVKKF